MYVCMFSLILNACLCLCVIVFLLIQLMAAILINLYCIVCMSHNLYPARLKQKSHSRAAVSNKQKRLQCLNETSSSSYGLLTVKELFFDFCDFCHLLVGSNCVT